MDKNGPAMSLTPWGGLPAEEMGKFLNEFVEYLRMPPCRSAYACRIIDDDDAEHGGYGEQGTVRAVIQQTGRTEGRHNGRMSRRHAAGFGHSSECPSMLGEYCDKHLQYL